MERVCFLAFGLLELMVGVIRILDLENAIEEVYEKANEANLSFIFETRDDRKA